MKSLFISIFILLSGILTRAQEINIPAIDAYLSHLQDQNLVMGSVTISQNGAPLYHRVIGYTDPELGTLAPSDIQYRLASITKTFTAILILKAQEEGKLSLEDKLSEYFPKVKNAEQITLEHLLRHSSGIFNYTELEHFLDWCNDIKDHQEVLHIIEQMPSNFAPGSGQDYSNSGYFLLGKILERVYAKSYDTLITEKITTPLGVSGIYASNGGEESSRVISGFIWDGVKWKPEDFKRVDISGGAGMLIGGGPDLLTIIDGLFAGKLLSSKSLEQMLTFEQYYGLGVFQMPFYQYNGVGHTGKFEAFETLFIHFPEQKRSISILINATQLELVQVHVPLLRALFGKDIPIETSLKR